jgi:hypothetical protein
MGAFCPQVQADYHNQHFKKAEIQAASIAACPVHLVEECLTPHVPVNLR